MISLIDNWIKVYFNISTNGKLSLFRYRSLIVQLCSIICLYRSLSLYCPINISVILFSIVISINIYKWQFSSPSPPLSATAGRVLHRLRDLRGLLLRVRAHDLREVRHAVQVLKAQLWHRNPWENHGKTTKNGRNPWEIHQKWWKTIGKPTQNDGKPWEKRKNAGTWWLNDCLELILENFNWLRLQKWWMIGLHGAELRYTNKLGRLWWIWLSNGMRISWVGNADDGRIALFSGWRFSEHGILLQDHWMDHPPFTINICAMFTYLPIFAGTSNGWHSSEWHGILLRIVHPGWGDGTFPCGEAKTITINHPPVITIFIRCYKVTIPILWLVKMALF